MEFNMNPLSLADQFKDKGFFDSPLHIKAKKDFQFLCSQTGYAALNNVNFLSVKTIAADKYVGEFMPLGYKTSGKSLTFSKEIFDIEKPNSFIAAVVYNNYDEVVDVFLFGGEVIKKNGLFSMVKFNKNDNTYSINLGDGLSQKLKQYSFGYVLKNQNNKD